MARPKIESSAGRSEQREKGELAQDVLTQPRLCRGDLVLVLAAVTVSGERARSDATYLLVCPGLQHQYERLVFTKPWLPRTLIHLVAFRFAASCSLPCLSPSLPFTSTPLAPPSLQTDLLTLALFLTESLPPVLFRCAGYYAPSNRTGLHRVARPRKDPKNALCPVPPLNTQSAGYASAAISLGARRLRI